MFGFEFLFGAALWALPLAGIPILLHLLFRRKSPIVQFSTLRFIKSSIQRTAARKKIQRWLLLACRALLLALLIWAIAQPARKLGGGSLGGSGGESLAAAIVVDTSYSMLLQDQQVTLLQRANDTVEDLLRNELRDAQVAIFRSQPAPSANPERLEPAADFRGDRWAPLSPTPSPVPLIDRVAAASDLLKQSDASRKWLIVITDGQRHEFPRPLSAPPQGTDFQTMLIDLSRPDGPSMAAITRVVTNPAQPRLGMPAEAAVDVAGPAGDAREVKLIAAPADRPEAVTPFPPMEMARIRATGTAEVSSPMPFVNSAWVLVTGKVTGDEPLPWATSRTDLVHIPPRQPAAVLSIGRPNDVAERIVRLALDPSEGERAAWPIAVRPGQPLGDEALVVALLTDWPDEPTARQLADVAQRGGSVMLFVQPGLETTWAALPQSRQTALAALLPSAPGTAPAGAFHGVIAVPNDPILTGVGDHSDAAAARLVVTRLVSFDAGDADVMPIIKALANDPDSASGPIGLLWRRTVGAGSVYTWATMPDRTCGNLRVSELFPPTLVNATLRPQAQNQSLNVEIGQPIVLNASSVPPGVEIDVTPPGRPTAKVDLISDEHGRRYVFTDTSQPGIYVWSKTIGGQTEPTAWTNVQIPAAEARLEYRSIDDIAPANIAALSGRSLDEVRTKLSQSQEPEPHWSWAIALVLLLLCLEALMGSVPKMWKVKMPRFAPVAGAGVQ